MEIKDIKTRIFSDSVYEKEEALLLALKNDATEMIPYIESAYYEMDHHEDSDEKYLVNRFEGVMVYLKSLVEEKASEYY